MDLKSIFPRLPGGSKTQRIQADAPRHRTMPIKCHDCHARGHITLHNDGDYTLPPGWVMAWRWFRPLYTCPACGEKRRKWVREHILNRP